MKKLLVIFCLVFIADYCFAQLDTSYPSPPQQLGRKNVLVVDSGGLKSAQMFVAPIYVDTTTANTANPYTRSYVASVIYTQDKQAYWFRQDVPRKWVLMGSSSGNNNTDTIFTEIPIAVKIDSLGRHIIYFLRPNGLYGGGIVTVDSCMTIDITPPTIVVNYVQYTGLQTIGVTIQPADPSLPRIDRVVMDTSLQIIVIEGMPSSTPVPPEYNSFSQVSLAEIPVGAAITCLGNAEIIFDGVADFAGQWTISTSGTGVTGFTNTANPYHLTQASYTVTYSNGYQIIYTKPTGTDTVKATSVLKGFITVVGTYPNQISGQWFNGSTAVSNQLLLNSYFNVNDSNNYQIFSPQLSAWSWPGGTVYNKLVLTFGGNDNSGSNGVYLDWLQIQTGIGNAANKQYQDSSSIVAGFLTDWYNGVPITRQAVGGGGTVTADNGLNISSGSNVQWGGTLIQPVEITENTNAIIIHGGQFVVDNYLVIDSASQNYRIGDLVGTGNETYMHVDDANQSITFNGFSVPFLSSGYNQHFALPQYRSGGTLVPGVIPFVVTDTGKYKPVVIDTLTGEISQSHWYGSGGGGGGNTIYTGDDALAGDRTVDLNGKILNFQNSGSNFIHIDPTSFQGEFKATDGVLGESGFSFTADQAGGDVLFNLLATDGTNSVSIFGDAVANTLEYTSATHTFNGIVNIIGSFSLPYIEVTSTYTITSLDYTVNCPSGTFTVTLPTAVGISGRIYTVKNSGIGLITLDGDGSETIDGSATQPISAGNSLTVQSTNAGWIIL